MVYIRGGANACRALNRRPVTVHQPRPSRTEHDLHSRLKPNVCDTPIPSNNGDNAAADSTVANRMGTFPAPAAAASPLSAPAAALLHELLNRRRLLLLLLVSDTTYLIV